MKTKMTKKFVSGILVISMILGLVSVGNLSGNVQTVKAETGETASAETRTVNLQIDGDIAGVTNPAVPTDATSEWLGSKVYFGKYNNNPVLFRVLDAKTTDYSADGTTQTMLLDSDTLFAAKKFNQGEANNSWLSSDIKTWMQGTGANQFLNQFSGVEKGTIIASNKKTPSETDGTLTAGTSFAPLVNDTVFALDAVELKNTSYGYSDTDNAVTNRIKKLGGNATWWWTRTSVNDGSHVRFVYVDGKIANGGTPNSNEMAFDPAMNLNLSSILFTSVSGQTKTSSFTTTEASDSDTWKLTLAGGKGFTATLSDSVITLEETINVNIANLGTDLSDGALTEGYYSQLSAMLIDGNGTVLAYGKIGDAATGTVSFTLPNGVDKGTYTLKVFAEKVNSSATNNATDYASNMASFTLDVIEAKNINLQINGKLPGITNPVAPTNETSAWSGSKVYFGKYANDPVLFRVLDANTTDYSTDGTTETMLLDSDALFPVMLFDKDKIDNSWKNSDVRTWLQGTGDNQFMRQFSATELEVIIESQKSQLSLTDGLEASGSEFSVLENETVFILDAAEAKNTTYGYSNSEDVVANRVKKTIDGTTLWWWTRTPLKFQTDNYVRFINTNGKIGNANITGGNTMGVSPAMNLDLSSVLYASASGVTQTSELAAVGTDLVANNTWKLTLLDDSKTVGIQETKSVYQNGTTVTVPYTYTGSDISQLSIMITSTERTDAAAEVLYYGALTTVTGEEGSGTATFELPSDLPEGYKIYLLAEDVNEGNFTNYASEPVEIGIVISEDLTADFATFRDGETMEAPTAPSGYVFAGWYYDEACVSSPVSTSTKTLEDGAKVYAKFVPETVLSVKGQSRYTKGSTSKIDLRLVTTVDSFQYREVGFIVTNRAGTPKTYKQQYVFASLLGAGIKYTPEFFNACSIRFGTINISGVTVSGEGVDPNRVIPAQAYWITKDGTRVTGPARTIKMSDAVASAEQVKNEGESNDTESPSVFDLVDFVVEMESGREPRILHLSDTQIMDSTQERNPERLDTTASEEYWAPGKINERLYDSLTETINATNPDLILLTGDLVYGEFDDNGTMFKSLIAKMDSFGIPWAPVFGNHDNESAKGVDWQCEQLENAKHCLFAQRILTGNGNYTVGIKQDGELKRVFFMMDSNGCTKMHENSKVNGHYKTTKGLGQDQMDWSINLAQEIKAASVDTKISYAFHTQIQAFADAYAKYGFTNSDTENSPINIDQLENKVAGDFGYLGRDLKDPWDTDYTFYNRMKEVGVDSIFVGHEHCNSASVVYDGIRFQFAQKIGTYDRTNFVKDNGDVLGVYGYSSRVEGWTPLSGGTVMVMAEDGSFKDAYIHLTGDAYAKLNGTY